MPAAPPTPSWSYKPSLDGLRTIAIYTIVLFHTEVSWLHGGFIAVNLFFVLSGYLVANVVLDEIDRTGHLSLANFYARRVRRLLPAAVLTIVGTSVLFLLITSVVRRLSIVRDAQSALLYVANWRFISQANDYFATNVDKSPFLHFWTLGIEEQFYVVFPVLLLLLSRARGRRVMLAGLGVVFVLSLGAQVYWAHADPIHAYYGTDARLYQLVAGGLVAVGMRYWRVRVPDRAARLVAVGGTMLFLLLLGTVLPISQTLRGIIGTVACVAMVAGLMQAEDQPLGRLLSRRTPVYLGKISYATYLWHWPIILALKEVLDIGPVTFALLAGVAATAMAAASAELLELPIRRSHLLDRFRWRVVLVGVTSSALAAVTVVPWVLGQDRQPALAASKSVPSKQVVATPKSKVHHESMPEHVDWKKIDARKGQEHTCTADDPGACTLVRGSGPHILVIGDSQARMLSRMFTRLAKQHDLTLSMNDIAGCMWQENLVNTQSGPKRQERCTRSRVGWYEHVLPKLNPDLVVVISDSRLGGKWNHVVHRRHGKKEPLERATLGATRRTLRKIDKVASRTLMIKGVVTPDTFEPNDCLTSTKEPAQCTVPVTTDVDPLDGYYETQAARSPDYYTVNLNPALCPDAPVCRPVVDGRIVWRDKHHYTPTFASARRDKVWRQIKQTGVLDRLGSR